MNIKELAEQAGIGSLYGKDWAYSNELTRFAELVAAAEREQCANHYLGIMRDAVEQAVLRERESCAKLCEEREEYQMPIPCPDGITGCCVAHFVRGSKLKDAKECAAAIRARGGKHD